MIDLLSVFFPRRCAVCRARTGSAILCAGCDKKMKALKAPDYEEPSKYFNVKADSVVWLFEYHDDFVKKLIYSYKYRHDPSLARLFADMLSDRILASKALSPYDPEKMLISFVPRSRKNVLKYGFDQAEMLAKGIGKRLGVKVIRLYNHVSGRVEQKTLTRAERLKNASSSFALIKPVKTGTKAGRDIGGRTLFIVDDVITTGASVNSCITKLKGGGYEKIVAVCIAKT